MAEGRGTDQTAIGATTRIITPNAVGNEPTLSIDDPEITQRINQSQIDPSPEGARQPKNKQERNPNSEVLLNEIHAGLAKVRRLCHSPLRRYWHSVYQRQADIINNNLQESRNALSLQHDRTLNVSALEDAVIENIRALNELYPVVLRLTPVGLRQRLNDIRNDFVAHGSTNSAQPDNTPAGPRQRDAIKRRIDNFESLIAGQETTLEQQIANHQTEQLESNLEQLAKALERLNSDAEQVVLSPREKEQKRAQRRSVTATLNSGESMTPTDEQNMTQAINQARSEIEPPTPTERQIQDVDRRLAAYIRNTDWNADNFRQWRARGELNNDQAVIEDFLRRNPETKQDDLLRRCVVEESVKRDSADASRYAEISAQKARKRNGRASKVLNFLGTSAVGIVGGTTVRHLVQQTAIFYGLGNAHLIGGLGGAAGGAVIGGAFGFFRGRNRARSELYEGSRVTNEVKNLLDNGQITDAEAIALYQDLLRNRQISGNEQEIVSAISAIADARANMEFKLALEKVQPLENESPQATKIRLARILTSLQLQRSVDPNGSQSQKNEQIFNYLKAKRVEANKEGRGEMWKGAAWGAGLGGVFGFLFNGPGIEAQIKARAMTLAPEHLTNHATLSENSETISKAVETFRDKVVAIKAAHAGQGTEAIRDAVTGYIKSEGYNFKDMLAAHQHGDTEFAREIGYRLGLDLHGGFGENNAQSVQELLNKYLEIAPKDASGNLTENGLRGAYHLLSHPGAYNEHWGQFLPIIERAGELSGHDFSAQAIHGGTPWWQPFTGAPFMQGGEFSNDVSASARDWITTYGPDKVAERIIQAPWFLNTETPWMPILAWSTLSGGARYASENGGENGAIDRIKKAGEKVAQRLGLKTEKEKGEGKPTGTEIIEYDKRLPEFIDKQGERVQDPAREKLQKELRRFKFDMIRNHGNFVFLPPDGPGKEPRALRIWPIDTVEARPNRLNKNLINSPDQQGLTGQTNKMGDANAMSLLDNGRVQVLEFDLSEVYQPDNEDGFLPLSKTPGGNRLDKEGDHDYWKTRQRYSQGALNRRKTIDIDDLFQPSGSEKIAQLFVAPKEADMYARAIFEGWIQPGQKVDDLAKLFTEKAEQRQTGKEKLNKLKEDKDLLINRMKGIDTEVSDSPERESLRKEVIEKAQQLMMDDASLTSEAAVAKAIKSYESAVSTPDWHSISDAKSTEGTTPSAPKTPEEIKPQAIPKNEEEYKNVELPRGVPSDSGEGKVLLERLSKALNGGEIEPFHANDRHGQWLMRTLKSMGYTVNSTTDNNGIVSITELIAPVAAETPVTETPETPTEDEGEATLETAVPEEITTAEEAAAETAIASEGEKAETTVPEAVKIEATRTEKTSRESILNKLTFKEITPPNGLHREEAQLNDLLSYKGRAVIQESAGGTNQWRIAIIPDNSGDRIQTRTITALDADEAKDYLADFIAEQQQKEKDASTSAAARAKTLEKLEEPDQGEEIENVADQPIFKANPELIITPITGQSIEDLSTKLLQALEFSEEKSEADRRRKRVTATLKNQQKPGSPGIVIASSDGHVKDRWHVTLNNIILGAEGKTIGMYAGALTAQNKEELQKGIAKVIAREMLNPPEMAKVETAARIKTEELTGEDGEARILSMRRYVDSVKEEVTALRQLLQELQSKEGSGQNSYTALAEPINTRLDELQSQIERVSYLIDQAESGMQGRVSILEDRAKTLNSAKQSAADLQQQIQIAENQTPPGNGRMHAIRQDDQRVALKKAEETVAQAQNSLENEERIVGQRFATAQKETTDLVKNALQQIAIMVEMLPESPEKQTYLKEYDIT